MTLTLVEAVKRRLRLIPILAALIVRGSVLHAQPFARPVPSLISAAFLAGAVVLVLLLLHRRPWPDWMFAVGAASTGGPYLAYVGWVVSWHDGSGVIAATLVDLLLLAWLIASTWGKVRRP